MPYASDSTTPQPPSVKALQLARFVAAIAWAISCRVLSDSSARGLTNRFNLDSLQPLLGCLFLLFLLTVGFSLLEMIARRPSSARSVLGLPKRPGNGKEWAIGAALGWGMVVLAVLPIAISGRLHLTFWIGSGALRMVLLNLLTVASGALAVELIFRGYPYRCLMEATGSVLATIVMSVLFALAEALVHGANSRAILIAMLMGVVFSVAWLRTHGLWLAWGMRFAWIISMGMIFGLPVSGNADSSILIQTVARGRSWLTGGSYGPEGAWFTAIALIFGLVVLIRVTRDYAWHYTHTVIVAGGYPMEAKPPAAHTAMEEAQNRPPSLVQILPNAPQGRSVQEPPES